MSRTRTRKSRSHARLSRFEGLEARCLMSVAEPNNTLAQAVNLNLIQAGQSYDDVVGTADTVDYFRFQVRARGPLEARLLQTGGDGHAYVLLFHDKNGDGAIGAGERIATSGTEPVSNAENLTMPVVEPGNVYYLGVFRATGTTAKYGLRVVVDYAGNTPSTARDLGEVPLATTVIDFIGSSPAPSYNDPLDAYKVRLIGESPSATLHAQLEPAAGGSFDSPGPRIGYAKDDNGNGALDPGEISFNDQGDAGHRYFSLGFGNVGDAYIVVGANGTDYQDYRLTLDVNQVGNSLESATNLGTLNGLITQSETVWCTPTFFANEDFYSFTLPAKAEVAFPAIAQADDVRWEVRNATGSVNSSAIARIGFRRALDAGTYTIMVSQTQAATSRPVDYSLRITADFAGDGPLTARKLGTISNFTRVNDYVATVVSGEDARDYFSFTLAEPQPLYAELRGVGLDSNIALYKDLDDNVGGLELIAESKNKLALDTIDRILPPGKYQLFVSSAAGSGQYDLKIWPGDPDDTFRETRTRSVNQRAVGQVINGGIEDVKDVDLFSFTATREQTIAFDVDVRAGRPFDSYLRLFDASGNELASNDNGASPTEKAGKFSYLVHTFASPGTYYVGVSSAGNDRYNPIAGGGDRAGKSLGRYTLALRALQVGSNTVSGTVFNDRNGNGRRDKGEAGLGGRTVFLDLDGDGALDEDELAAVTAADGSYRITGAPGGPPRILRLANSTGWSPTTPAARTLTLTMGQTSANNVFGVKKL